jgi:hypothetical protein
MSTAAFPFLVMSMMAVVLAAASRYFTVPALRIIGRRFLDAERLLGVLVRSPRAALANARGSLC